MTQTEDSPATSGAARRGRPRKGAPQLSRATIVEATFAVIDAHGIDAVGMRAVARRLGVDPKSLYNHVDGKEGLLDAVAESVLGAIELPSRTGDPAVDLAAVAHAFRQSALRRPQAAALVLTRPLASIEGLAPVDAVLAALAEAGCAPADAVHLLRMFVATIVGSLLREVNAGPTFGSDDPAVVQARERELSRSGLPAVERAAPLLAAFDAETEFAYGVDVLVEVALGRAARA